MFARDDQVRSEEQERHRECRHARHQHPRQETFPRPQEYQRKDHRCYLPLAGGHEVERGDGKRPVQPRRQFAAEPKIAEREGNIQHVEQEVMIAVVVAMDRVLQPWQFANESMPVRHEVAVLDVEVAVRGDEGIGAELKLVKVRGRKGDDGNGQEDGQENPHPPRLGVGLLGEGKLDWTIGGQAVLHAIALPGVRGQARRTRCAR